MTTADLITREMLKGCSTHSEKYDRWRRRQEKFSYPLALARRYGVGVAAALYFVLNRCAEDDRLWTFLSDSEVQDWTAASLVEVEEMRERCSGFLKATLVNQQYSIYRYDLDVRRFLEQQEGETE